MWNGLKIKFSDAALILGNSCEYGRPSQFQHATVTLEPPRRWHPTINIPLPASEINLLSHAPEIPKCTNHAGADTSVNDSKIAGIFNIQNCISSNDEISRFAHQFYVEISPHDI